MKQRSVYFQAAVVFFLSYTVYALCFWVYQVQQVYREISDVDSHWESTYVDIGHIYLKAGEDLALSEVLEKGVELGEIDYYLIRKGDEDLAFASAALKDDQILFKQLQTTDKSGKQIPFDGGIDNSDYRFAAMHEGSYSVFIGHKKGAWNFISRFFKKERVYIFSDIAFVFCMTLGLLLYSLRDMREVLKRIRTRSVNRADTSIARSSETLELIQGLKGFQTNVETLTKENVLLKGHVLPALKKEISSNRVPPYEFGCTMVRTDINNFTTIFSNHDRAKFMAVINEFFVGVSHIVSRYRGYVYEFIGDEVIFYFKDEDHQNSAAIAISALRDINAFADEVSASTTDDGYEFRIKSSLAWGTLRFGPLVNGFSLAGKPLIETVRILSHVHEKSENTILFEESLAEQFSLIATNREFGVVMLKGLGSGRRLRIHDKFVPLNHHLRQGSEESFTCTRYYRSNKDICETLDYLKVNFGQIESGKLAKLVAHFKDFRVTENSPEVRQSYLSCLHRLLDLCAASEWQKEEDGSLISSLVASASELFPAGALTGRLRETLLACLQSPVRRVIANTLDVFAALDPDAGEAVFEKLATYEDNRIMANALIKQSKRDWNQTTAKRLGVLLRMKNMYYQASGLYALGEIAHHLKSLDEVSFQADSKLQALIESSAASVAHANKMVRRQAMRALIKAGRKTQLSEMVGYEELSAEIRAEIRLICEDAEPIAERRAA